MYQYQDQKEMRRALNGKMIVMLVGIMLDRPDVARQIRDQYRHFVVDEYQDVNAPQYLLLRELAGDGASDTKGKDASGQTRILWTLSIGKHGELLDIKPFGQKRSRRGWSTPKAMPLSRLAGDQSLTLEDAKLARCLRPDRYYSKRYTLDLAAAIGALVGHPAVALEAAPDVLVELVETQPELEVVRRGDKIAMRISPPIRAEEEGSYYHDAEQKRDAEALRLITLQPDGPQRVRLIRYTVAQKRAAQLVSGRFAVPANAEGATAELDKTLQALTGHFQVHADSAQASRQALNGR